MNPVEIQKIFQTVQKRFRCPHCGKQYAFGNIHIINSIGNVCFLQLECSDHASVMASVTVSNHMDKNIAEEKISANEILDAYDKIEKISSVEELFK